MEIKLGTYLTLHPSTAIANAQPHTLGRSVSGVPVIVKADIRFVITERNIAKRTSIANMLRTRVIVALIHPWKSGDVKRNRTIGIITGPITRSIIANNVIIAYAMKTANRLKATITHAAQRAAPFQNIPNDKGVAFHISVMTWYT